MSIFFISVYLALWSTGASSVIIRHPILSTFRYYMHSDFGRNNINPGIPMLNDCLEQGPLYFWVS
jgi:hypothetical protein